MCRQTDRQTDRRKKRLQYQKKKIKKEKHKRIRGVSSTFERVRNIIILIILKLIEDNECMAHIQSHFGRICTYIPF